MSTRPARGTGFNRAKKPGEFLSETRAARCREKQCYGKRTSHTGHKEGYGSPNLATQRREQRAFDRIADSIDDEQERREEEPPLPPSTDQADQADRDGSQADGIHQPGREQQYTLQRLIGGSRDSGQFECQRQGQHSARYGTSRIHDRANAQLPNPGQERTSGVYDRPPLSGAPASFSCAP